MKTIIYKQNRGGKPEVYARECTLKKAQQILIKKYEAAIEFLYDEIVDGRDTLSKDRKELVLFNNRFWIEPDKSL